MAVAPWVVSDELWSRIEPLLPKVERRFRDPGRKRLPGSAGAAGDLVRALHGDRVAPSAGRARLRWRLDPSPADAWVAAGGRLGATARGVARGVTRFGRDRLVASGRGLQPCTGEKGASATGPSPVDRARSPAARPNTAPGSAACAGSSSEPSRGCTTTSGFPSATTAATRCTKQSSLSPAASSASGGERLSL